jgi:hypothetical protein
MSITKRLGVLLLSGLTTCATDSNNDQDVRNDNSQCIEDIVGQLELTPISETHERALGVIGQGLYDALELTEKFELERSAYANLFLQEREKNDENIRDFVALYRINGSLEHPEFFQDPDNLEMTIEEFRRLQVEVLRQIASFRDFQDKIPNVFPYNIPNNLLAWYNHYRLNSNPRSRDIARTVYEMLLSADTSMGADRFVEQLERGTSLVESHYPSAATNPVSLRRFGNFSANMFLTLMICESTGSNYTPEGRIEYFRMMINSGYNPYHLVTNFGDSLDTGAFQNTPSSTSGDVLSNYWSTSQDYKINRDVEIPNPFTSFSFHNLVLDPDLQHLVTAAKIIQGLHGVGGRLFIDSPENLRRLTAEYENLIAEQRTNIDVVFTSIAHNTRMDEGSNYSNWSQLIYENRNRSLLEIYEEILRNNAFSRSALAVYNSLISNADL